MNYKTHIVLIPVDKISDGRTKLEKIENGKFESIEAVENAICFYEDDPIAVEDLEIWNMSDFVDACNNTDEETPDEERMDVFGCWIGYVRIKV